MKFPVFILLFSLAGPVFSVPLSALVESSLEPALLKGERLSRVQDKNLKPQLIPNDAYVKDLVNGMIAGLGPNFLVETLSLYRKPAGAAVPQWSPAERTALYNQSLALSSLAGLKYYSESRKELRTFYESSSVVDGPDAKTPVPDPSYANPPEELTVYARQKDLSFGDNVYKYDYHARQNALIFVQENLSAMSYGPIPAVGKNKLRSMAAVFDAGDYLLFYAVSMARAASIPGMSGRVGRSFITRAEAVLTWFAGRADRAFKI
ncbi:MAG: hypothetical protein LBQ44_03900 [Treponema sp.]|jgi:hypothetical protein|nr:hypothetical protein [Treponema sp.]